MVNLSSAFRSKTDATARRSGCGTPHGENECHKNVRTMAAEPTTKEKSSVISAARKMD